MLGAAGAGKAGRDGEDREGGIGRTNGAGRVDCELDCYINITSGIYLLSIACSSKCFLRALCSSVGLLAQDLLIQNFFKTISFA
jgi:hypothetical protein